MSAPLPPPSSCAPPLAVSRTPTWGYIKLSCSKVLFPLVHASACWCVQSLPTSATVTCSCTQYLHSHLANHAETEAQLQWWQCPTCERALQRCNKLHLPASVAEVYAVQVGTHASSACSEPAPWPCHRGAAGIQSKTRVSVTPQSCCLVWCIARACWDARVNAGLFRTEVFSVHVCAKYIRCCCVSMMA